MTTPPAPDDSPLPHEMVSVRFVDGALAGTSVMVDNQTCHHWKTKTEYYTRFSEAPDGTLRSFFKLRTPSRPNPPAPR